MNPKNLTLLALALAGAAAVPLAARADDTTAAPTPTPTMVNQDLPPADGSQPPAPPPGGRRRGGGYNLKELTAKLDLTPDQQKTIGGIIASGRSQSKALRDDDSLAPDDKRAKMREIMTTTKSQIRAALTADQQKIFDTLPTRGGPPPAPPAAEPTPTPPPTT